MDPLILLIVLSFVTAISWRWEALVRDIWIRYKETVNMRLTHAHRMAEMQALEGTVQLLLTDQYLENEFRTQLMAKSVPAMDEPKVASLPNKKRKSP